jgi:hypothetical protein
VQRRRRPVLPGVRYASASIIKDILSTIRDIAVDPAAG